MAMAMALAGGPASVLVLRDGPGLSSHERGAIPHPSPSKAAVVAYLGVVEDGKAVLGEGRPCPLGAAFLAGVAGPGRV